MSDAAPDLTAIGACAEAAIGYALCAAKIVEPRIRSVSLHLGNPEIPATRFWVAHIEPADKAGCGPTLAEAIAAAQRAVGEGQP